MLGGRAVALPHVALHRGLAAAQPGGQPLDRVQPRLADESGRVGERAEVVAAVEHGDGIAHQRHVRAVPAMDTRAGRTHEAPTACL